MRAYLAIAAAEPAGRIPESLLLAVRGNAGPALPVKSEDLVESEWVSADRGSALLAWSNEPRCDLLPQPLIGQGGRVLGHCGYLAEPDKDERLLLEARDLGSVTERLGGCFSVFRADEHGFEVATSITRVCPVYHAEAAGLRFAGSRALLVHLASRFAATGRTDASVDLDVPTLQPMVRHGFFTSDETPFTGVRAVPNSATLLARRGRAVRIRETPFPEPAPPPVNKTEIRERLTGTAEALLAAVRPIQRHGEPVWLSLSGGRDSRLLAAALHAAGVPFRARTHGFADSPDVVLASQVAKRLGIEHQLNLTEPSDDAARPSFVEVEHPLTRAVNIIRTCEGMNSAYEGVRLPGDQSFSLNPSTSGSGGETLRGGFLYDQADTGADALRRRVRSIFLSAEAFVTPEGNARAAAAHAPWDLKAQQDGFDALDQLYLRYRTGRWLTASHTMTLATSAYYHPFLDNRVIREALALPARWRHDEQLVYGLIELLAPQLGGIPPEGKRWRFEASGPRSLLDRRSWRRRAALVPSGGTSGFNWRKSYDDAFLAILRDQVMEGPAELFDIVHEPKAREYFAQVPTSWINQGWHIFTLSVLLSKTWLRGTPDLPRVRIPVPTS